jgi:hypothetical protein
MNPIVAENQLAGTDSSVWDIADSGDGTFKYGDPSFQGYAVPFSVNLGQQVTFKIKLIATPIRYHIDIYRLGYCSGGEGARQVATIPSSQLMHLKLRQIVCSTRLGLRQHRRLDVNRTGSARKTISHRHPASGGVVIRCRRRGPSSNVARSTHHRLLNWKLRRAFALPYFFRSTARESRVRNPATLRMLRRSGS